MGKNCEKKVLACRVLLLKLPKSGKTKKTVFADLYILTSVSLNVLLISLYNCTIIAFALLSFITLVVRWCHGIKALSLLDEIGTGLVSKVGSWVLDLFP